MISVVFIIMNMVTVGYRLEAYRVRGTGSLKKRSVPWEAALKK